MKEYLEMWRRFADFSGVTSRRGYWMASLINLVVATVIGFIATELNLVILSSLYSIAILIPGLSISIRRLRDAGCHWGNLFWPLLPLVGSIILIVKLCKPSVKPVNA